MEIKPDAEQRERENADLAVPMKNWIWAMFSQLHWKQIVDTHIVQGEGE